MPKEKISVIVTAYNEERCISDCVKAILGQTVPDFELIMVDDGSTDNTWAVINSIQDARIRRVRLKRRSGYSTARNAGLNLVKDGIVFFTDADCRPSPDWLEKGMIPFREEDIAGVGGVTKYVAGDKHFTPGNLISFSSFTQPNFSTDNVAYKARLLHLIQGFRERYNDGLEDIDLNIRVRAASEERFVFSQEMFVTHIKKDYDLHRIILWLRRAKQPVYLIKDHHENLSRLKAFRQGRIKFINLPLLKTRFFWIIRPFHLLIMVFPPSLYFFFKGNKIKILRVKDIAYIPLVYGYMLFLRIAIWVTAIRERFFVL